MPNHQGELYSDVSRVRHCVLGRTNLDLDAQNSSECVHLDALEKFIHMQIIRKCKVHAFLIDI